MFKIPAHLHYTIYLGALILLVVSLPFSVFLLSVAQIILVINWLAEGNFPAKWLAIKQRKSLLFLSLFYLVHLLWLINTSDFSWGFHDVKIKLPLLVLPLVIGTSRPLSEQKFKMVLSMFLLSVFAASLYSSYRIMGLDGHLDHTIQEISPFVSPIRLALMVVTALLISVWMIRGASVQYKGMLIIFFLWLLYFLFVLEVLTGVVILVFVSVFFLLRMAFLSRQMMIRWFSLVFCLTVVLLFASYLSKCYTRFYTFDKIDTEHLDKFTSRGNPYYHERTSKSVENGHYIYFYICEKELRDAWKMRSRMDYDGKTQTGSDLKTGLIRYLTSKGLRKDADGVDRLTNRDIRYIEWGKTNYIDTNKYSLYPRVYKALWELYVYRNGGNPTGYSISQRIEFVKTAFHIIRQHPWFGVGTGDAPVAFAKQYETDRSPLALTNRLRAHNQLVTFVITFGVIGGALVLFALIAPPLYEQKFSSYLFLIIFIVGFLSFLNEDTLETHQGISFFAVFYSLFLFCNHEKRIPEIPS